MKVKEHQSTEGKYVCHNSLFLSRENFHTFTHKTSHWLWLNVFSAEIGTKVRMLVAKKW